MGARVVGLYGYGEGGVGLADPVAGRALTPMRKARWRAGDRVGAGADVWCVAVDVCRARGREFAGGLARAVRCSAK